MFTGDSSYACAYLALGNRTAADAQLQLAFGHVDPHFYVFTETQVTDGGHTQHFITGAGGFVQGFVFGYSGMRIARVGVLTFTAQRPVLPPGGVTAATLRGVHLLGTRFDFRWNATHQCAELQSTAMSVVVVGAKKQKQTGEALEVRIVGTTVRWPLTDGAAPVCVTVEQPVEVAGVGYL